MSRLFALIPPRAIVRKAAAIRARDKKTAKKAVAVLELYQAIVKAVYFSRVYVTSRQHFARQY